MPTPTKGPRFGGSPAHQRLILANLATSLFEHGQITTTEAKARRLRPYAEHLITKAKVDSVANRRQVVRVIRDRSVLHTLFTEIGPRFATRPGGYTRITKINPRKGDNAPMAVIGLVEAKEFATTGAKHSTPAAKRATPVAASAPAEVDEATDLPADSRTADGTGTTADSAADDATTAPTPDAEVAADETTEPVEGDARDEEAEADSEADKA